MATWIHVWGAPYVASARDSEGVSFATARQACERCGVQRNPFTLALTKRVRGSICLDNPQPSGERDHSAALDHVRSILAAYKADGIRVDRYHGGREPRPDPRELAYGR